jgi:hypothetical protein
MLATTFTCPECDSVLRLANPVAPGKKIKCPKCNTVFPVPDVEEKPASPIRSNGASGKPGGGKLSAEERQRAIDEDRRAVKGRRGQDEPDDYDDTPAARRGVRKRQVEDDYDRELDDDLDEVRPRKGAKKKKPAKSSKGLLIGLIVGGVVLLLGVGAIAAWVWPGFLKGGLPHGTGDENLVAYAPADSTILVGARIDTLVKELNLSKQLDQGLGTLKAVDGLGGETVAGLIKNGKEILVALKGIGPGMPTITVVLKTGEAYDQDKIAKAYKVDNPTSVDKGVYLKVSKKGAMGAFTFYVGMPNDRILIFTNGSESEIKTMVGSNGKDAKVSGDTAAIAKGYQGSAVWYAMQLDSPVFKAQMKQVMEGAGKAMGPNVNPQVKKNLEDSLKALDQIKSVGFAVTFGDPVKFTGTVSCTSEDVAKKLADSSKQAWGAMKLALPEMPGVKEAFKKEPDLAKGWEQLSRGATFTAKGKIAEFTFTLSKVLVDKLVAAIKQKVPGIGGGFPGPGGMGGMGGMQGGPGMRGGMGGMGGMRGGPGMRGGMGGGPGMRGGMVGMQGGPGMRGGPGGRGPQVPPPPP